MKALVLSGGGARGAYQAGAMLAVAEVAERLKTPHPIQIFTGVSAGAINAGFLAAGAEDFLGAAQKLVTLWSNLKSDKVFRTDAVSFGKIGLSWMGELSLGGLAGGKRHAHSLLDTSPLLQLLRENIEFSQIQKNIDSDIIHATAISALDYKTNETITFVQGRPEIKLWRRARRSAEKTLLEAEHILASSAIPILFQPAQVGARHFGDGCVRNGMPLSPALHLGASSLLVIGVRQWDQDLTMRVDLQTEVSEPSIARIANVLLNSVLLDSIETDLERLEKINQFLQKIPTDLHTGLNFKPVSYVSIHPSQDIGAIAARMSSRLPRIVRYLLKGLGPLDDASELISYLLFEPDFCQKLIEMGYQDGQKQKEHIENFFETPVAKGLP